MYTGYRLSDFLMAKFKDLTHIPLEDTPDPSQTVSGEICFFLEVWEVWGIFPCGQNH